MSREFIIEKIAHEKEEIRKTTNEIHDILLTIPSNEEIKQDSKELTEIRKKINQILKSLSIIAGFTDKHGKGLIYLFEEYIRLGLRNFAYKWFIEDVCIEANSVITDFSGKDINFSAEFENAVLRLKTKFIKK